ncbi:NAD(P)-dependent dehydrogenase (short-subunit alcohol dehydrogenase family) [Phyllobacterium trifolii]|uniref:NAD(P)-dependent dehydrogenase (Short-subunit alcohol dehydrogenase family) n=1 Tax=Phyllobacterium trifolii TaxID=300193 RepID=A0A839UED3_9HYPH|nr:NAD(P)-dependent dehydrogenase (short-subunit alcohol dehydrogenase family) [Phyllobacterium trifolii]
MIELPTVKSVVVRMKPNHSTAAAGCWLKEANRQKGRTPAGRWGRPEELIGTAVFLASNASGFVNGQIIYVDGGILSVV